MDTKQMTWTDIYKFAKEHPDLPEVVTFRAADRAQLAALDAITPMAEATAAAFDVLAAIIAEG